MVPFPLPLLGGEEIFLQYLLWEPGEVLGCKSQCCGDPLMSGFPGVFFFKDFIYFRERGREGEKEGEKPQSILCVLHTPCWGPGPQPRHVS